MGLQLSLPMARVKLEFGNGCALNSLTVRSALVIVL